jgi:hypothetical protein
MDKTNSQHRRSTLVEVAVVAVAMTVLVSLMLPAIQGAREDARRNQCHDNLKNLGLAFSRHSVAKIRLPSSSGVTRKSGKVVAIDGWSWCAQILPYLEMGRLADSVDLETGKPLVEPAGGGTPHADALATLVPELHCPSFGGSPHLGSGPTREAITNYKAIGATHLESLNVTSPGATVPRYGDLMRHPDGAIFPGSTHGLSAMSRDGTAHTILLAETVEPNAARWTVGSEACLVGLPSVVEFYEEPSSYAAPVGFTPNKFWADTTILPECNKTYLEWDYGRHPYSDGGVSTPSALASGPVKFGPSSPHARVTGHLFADGSGHWVGNKVDAGMYMFLITRDGMDPCPIDEPPMYKDQ